MRFSLFLQPLSSDHIYCTFIPSRAHLLHYLTLTITRLLNLWYLSWCSGLYQIWHHERLKETFSWTTEHLPLTLSQPNRLQQMVVDHWAVFCLRCLPLKRKFFLSAVAKSVLMGKMSGVCKLQCGLELLFMTSIMRQLVLWFINI